MDVIANTSDSFLDLSKLNTQEMRVIMEFYNFLIFKRKPKTVNIKNDIKKIPDIFYKPTKVDSYLVFEREEIYGRD